MEVASVPGVGCGVDEGEPAALAHFASGTGADCRAMRK